MGPVPLQYVYFFSQFQTKFHYDRTGVRVISINPGLTDTTILKSCVDNMPLEFKESFYTNVEKEYIQRYYYYCVIILN